MKTTGYEITTAYGHTYILDADGYVLSYSNGLRKEPDSESRKTWQITGAWFNRGFGHIGIITLDKLCQADIKLRSGLPRYGLTDIDHGTERLQGNKECHGVSTIKSLQV